MNNQLTTIVVNRAPVQEKVYWSTGYSPFIGAYIPDEKRWALQKKKKEENKRKNKSKK